MAVEQQVPEVARTGRIDLGVPTEVELCSRGAVKLTHMQLAEVKANYRVVLTDLQAERQRNDALAAHAVSVDTELRVIKAISRSNSHREIIVRTLELVIVALLTYAIDFEREGNSKSFIVFLVLSAILVVLIILVQLGSAPPKES